MEERFRFVTRRLEGESMTALCREFGISRKTGHKIFARYKAHGLEALGDRPRAPGRVANRLPLPIECQIVALRREKPHWGARLARASCWRGGSATAFACRPAAPSMKVADRHGLVEHARARRPRATGTPLSQAAMPNDVWCADFKGEFRLGNRRWCYPLTVTDQAARYILMCEALEGTQEAPVFTAFFRLFEERGLPGAIRSDVEPEVRLRRNGTPFASIGLYGLSRLAVWWLRLGIALERITPGRPRETRPARAHAPHGSKQETTRPAADNCLREPGPASTPSSRSSTPSARTRRWR